MQQTQLDQPIHCYDDQFFFKAMGCPCEIIIRYYDEASKKISPHISKTLSRLGLSEINRLECKYSRYKKESYLTAINQNELVNIDNETLYLFELADTCYQVSDGLFDITSGLLRKYWQFYGQEIKMPSDTVLKTTCGRIGWNKVQWHLPEFKLPQGMEIDLGGIVKEYAVDRVCSVFNTWIDVHFKHIKLGFLVNLGGDIRCVNRNRQEQPWAVSVEGATIDDIASKIQLCNKAIATSGIGHRYLMLNGQKYGHILNPITGMPIEYQPRSVSVISDNAVHAGMLASVAMTKGRDAEDFLIATGCQYILSL